MAWALLRGAFYSAAFLVTMVTLGLAHSWWAVLALPPRASSPTCSRAPGSRGTTFMRSWTDFDFVNLVLIPMFLFSGDFFPVSQYPDAVQGIVRLTPLYQGVVLDPWVHDRPAVVDHARERRLPGGDGHGRPERRRHRAPGQAPAALTATTRGFVEHVGELPQRV